MKNEKTASFNVTEIIENPVYVNNTSIEVQVVPICSEEQATKSKQSKQQLASVLNDKKNSGQISKNYGDQLTLELSADYQVFQYITEHCSDSPEDYMSMIDSLRLAYYCTGIDPASTTTDAKIAAINNYKKFLMSPQHHKLPYVWTRSVLFAHIMQRQNKIIHSDNLDIKWASAYLPFVDYVVTDSAFCNLLNQSGLAELYGTKVYCFKTIGKLLEEF